MYPEFIAIYIMLALVLVGLGAVIYLLLKVLNGGGSQNSNYAFSQQTTAAQPAVQQPAADNYYTQQQAYASAQQVAYPGQGGIVFCQRCATQFDASQAYCPQCGTRR